MNSTSRALIWELWRRNRWSFAMLLLLLITCTSIRICSDHLERKTSQLVLGFPALSSGSISVSELLPQSNAVGTPAEARIKVGTGIAGIVVQKVVPGDVISWSGRITASLTPEMKVTLNGREVRDGQPPPRLEAADGTPTDARLVLVYFDEWMPMPERIVIEVTGGGKRTISMLANLQYAEDLQAAEARKESVREAGLLWSLPSMGFSLLLLFAVFGSAEPHPSRGFTGIPPRRFTLPVTTTDLVLWPMLLGAGAVLAMSLVWTRLVLAGLIPAGSSIPHLTLALLLAAGLALFQACVWMLPSFPRTRIFLIAIAVFFLLVLSGVLVAPPGPSGPGWERAQPILTGACSVLWLCSIAAAWWGVKKERQGAWTSWGRRTSSANGAFPLTSYHLAPFQSPLAAQCWIEWRRNGRLGLTIWAGLILMIYLATRRNIFNNQVLPEFTSVAGILTVAWVAIAGLNMSRDPASRQLAMSSFSAVRPVTTGCLFSAKLIVGTCVWLAGVSLAGIAWVLVGMDSWNMTGTGIQIELHPMDLLVWLGMVAILFQFFWGTLPLCTWGRGRGFPWSLLPWLLIYGLAFQVIFWSDRHPEAQEHLLDLMAFVVLLKLVTAAWAFRQSLRTGITSPSAVTRVLVLWAGATSFLVWLAYLAGRSSDWPNHAMAMIPGVVLLLPLARIALSPLMLALNRHR